MQVERIACSPCQLVAEVASLMRARAQEKELFFDIRYVSEVPETHPLRSRRGCGRC